MPSRYFFGVPSFASNGLEKWDFVGEECGDPPRAADLTSPLLSCLPILPEPPWYPCTPLGRMMSSELRLSPQTPGSVCSRSPSRSSWAFLLASSGAVVISSQPSLGAWCPSPDPSPLWVSVSREERSPSTGRAAEALPAPVPPAPAVGQPIPVPQRQQPTEEQVDHCHRLCMKVLEQLCKEHKENSASWLPLTSPSSSPGLSPPQLTAPPQPLIPVPETPTNCPVTG